MNRWLGGAKESESQASARNQRAARRIIRNQLMPTSDEEFRDCETSFNTSLNLDGEPGETAETDIMAAAAAELARQKALPVQDANYADDDDAWKKEIKLKFDRSDVTYWFNSVESQMKKFGINMQWSKKDAIVTLLPEDVIEECKPILRLTQEEAGDEIYKTLKVELMSLYGPKDEDAFLKAMSLRLTTTPSALGKKLIHQICPGPKPFNGCHCAKIVYGFWHSQMTPPIKSNLAALRKKFDKDTYTEFFKLADDTWSANGGNATSTPTVVAAVAASNPSPLSPDDPPPQVAAAQRGGGRGRGGRGQRRGGRNNQGSGRGAYNNNSSSNQQNSNNQSQQEGQKPHQKGPKASPDVPSNACARHWKEGRNATYCSDPLVCSWVHIIAPRVPKQT